MSSKFIIDGEQGRLELKVNGYERDEASDFYDANWLSCEAQVRVRGFSAALTASLSAGDLRDFCDSLRQVLQNCGAATLHPIEEQLVLSLSVNASGLVLIKGIARQWDPAPSQLTFEFESSIQKLEETARQLQDITIRYPVRIRP